MRFKGKIALVTGATQGIGLAIARALAGEGCHLAICGRNEQKLKPIERDLRRQNVRVLATVCDVRDESSVPHMIQAVRRQFHHIDILINNAGIAHADLPIARIPVETWREVIDTNLTGPFLVTKAALPLMERGAVIVNNLSIAAKQVFPGSAAYNASKHGALGFTNTLREELRGKGIRVMALLPGATDTAIWNTLWPEAPRKKMMSPSAVARAVVAALATPANASVDEITITPSSGTL